jgi:hypothetical protein
MPIDANRYRKPRQPLGRWLLDQTARPGLIGDLAKAAKADPRFPVDGDFDRISKRLNELRADPDMHVALEDAELDWAAL